MSAVLPALQVHALSAAEILADLRSHSSTDHRHRPRWSGPLSGNPYCGKIWSELGDICKRDTKAQPPHWCQRIATESSLWACRSKLKRHAVQLAVTQDELATQSAAAVRARDEAGRLGREFERTAEQLAGALAEGAALRRHLAGEEDRRAAAQDDLQVASLTRVRVASSEGFFASA